MITQILEPIHRSMSSVSGIPIGRWCGVRFGGVEEAVVGWNEERGDSGKKRCGLATRLWGLCGAGLTEREDRRGHLESDVRVYASVPGPAMVDVKVVRVDVKRDSASKQAAATVPDCRSPADIDCLLC